MGRIPIYASKAPLRRTPMVRPQPDIAVSEAIGGLAETVGKIAMDWSTKKKDTEIQSEYVSNTIILKEAQATFLKAREDDPNPLDDDYIKSGYDEYMKTNLKDLVWKHNTSQKKFEQTRQISDLGTLQKAYDINRRKFISAEKVQGEIDTQKALNLRSKALIDLNISKLKPVYSTEVLKAKRIKDYHDLETLQIIDKLGIDINADLSEFKNVLPEEKNKLIKTAKDSVRAEANRLKADSKEKAKIYFEQTNDDFSNKFTENSLTLPEVEASTLPTKGEGGKMYWRDRVTTKAADETNEKESDIIRKKFALETITELDIDKRQDKLTDGDYKKFKKKYKDWEKAVINGKHTSSIFMSSTNMFYEELDRLAENGTITTKEAEEAKLKLPDQLYDKAMSGEISEDKIPDYSEFLIGSYLQKESQIRKDASAFKKFISLVPDPFGIKSREFMRREKRVKELPAKADFPTKEVEEESKEETIKIEGIPPENVTYYSDWLKKNKKVANEKNIRYLYEQFK